MLHHALCCVNFVLSLTVVATQCNARIDSRFYPCIPLCYIFTSGREKFGYFHVLLAKNNSVQGLVSYSEHSRVLPLLYLAITIMHAAWAWVLTSLPNHFLVFSDTCAAVLCGGLQDPDNGNIVVYTNGPRAGSLVIYRCDVGYRIVGSDTRQCLLNGSWSQQDPTCEGKLKL